MNHELLTQIHFADHRHLDPVNDNRAAGFSVLDTAAIIIGLVVFAVAFMWGIFQLENIILAGLGK